MTVNIVNIQRQGNAHEQQTQIQKTLMHIQTQMDKSTNKYTLRDKQKRNYAKSHKRMDKRTNKDKYKQTTTQAPTNHIYTSTHTTQTDQHADKHKQTQTPQKQTHTQHKRTIHTSKHTFSTNEPSTRTNTNADKQTQQLKPTWPHALTHCR